MNSDKLPEKPAELRCADCMTPYENLAMDVVLPDDQWEDIGMETNGILCASCIVARGKQRGRTVAFLSFDAPIGRDHYGERPVNVDKLPEVPLGLIKFAQEFKQDEAAALKKLAVAIGKALEQARTQEREACEVAAYETAARLGFEHADKSTEAGRGAWLAGAAIRAHGKEAT